MKPSSVVVLAAAALLTSACTGSAGLRPEATITKLRGAGPDGPPPEEMLLWSAAERRVGFAATDRIFPTRTVEAGTRVLGLPERPTDLTGVTYEIDGEQRTLADFIARPESIGLIVVLGGNVLLENYADGNGPDTRWISFSVTKSITSLLIGAAIQDGYIGDVDEPVANYLPRLRGTAYRHATIKDVLQMASGVAWDEDYADPESDVVKAGGSNGIALVEYLATLPVLSAPGERFNYSTGETHLAGELLRSAIGNNAASYLTRKIWQPFGMEHDAEWILDRNWGAELGGCCLAMTLRDYARVGLFAARDGVLADGTRVLPEGWMAASTSPSKGLARYGYLWWLTGDGSYAANGIYGQKIFVDPAANLVIAMHNSAGRAADREYGAEVTAVIEALRQRLR